jgi:hypothetical protein
MNFYLNWWKSNAMEDTATTSKRRSHGPYHFQLVSVSKFQLLPSKWWWSGSGYPQSTEPWDGTNRTFSAFYSLKSLGLSSPSLSAHSASRHQHLI